MKPHLLMLNSEWSKTRRKIWGGRTRVAVLCFLAGLFVLPASAQTDFTLTATPFNPDAVDPGGVSSSTITVVTANGFAGTVALSCVVTASISIPPSELPPCQVSPPSLTGSGGATATITTSGNTPEIAYSMTITGTDTSGTITTQPLALTVLAVAAQFTITVTGPISPNSVMAGNGAQGIVTVDPLDGYVTPPNGYITLYCGTITPLVTIAPVCSFAYPKGQQGLVINSDAPATSTITISTFGPVTTGAVGHPRNFYALWLSLPMLGLVGVGAAVGNKKSRRIFVFFAVFVFAAALMLLPGCTNTSATGTSTTTPNGITPANSYTFTIVGVDTNGVASSNTGSGSAAPTASLTVTAPTT